MIALGKRVFSLNSLIIPIRGLEPQYPPADRLVGGGGRCSSKTAYAYTATENAQGFLKLDLMQQRGIGAGIEHSLTSSTGSTKASLYFLADKQIGGNNITGQPPASAEARLARPEPDRRLSDEQLSLLPVEHFAELAGGADHVTSNAQHCPQFPQQLHQQASARTRR